MKKAKQQPLSNNKSFESERFKAHMAAKKLIQKCQYREAYDLFIQTVKVYGPHIGIMCDLVFVTQMLNEIQLHKDAVKNLEFEFAHCRDLLSAENLVRTLIFLGKTKEYAAEVFPALEYYQQAFDLAESDALKLKASAQLIRINSFLGKNSDLYVHYVFLNSRINQSIDTDIEISHSLMLSEFRLFGFQPAVERMKKILSFGLKESDIGQLSVNFLEECILHNYTPEDSLLEEIKVQTKLQYSGSLELEVFKRFFHMSEGSQLPCSDLLDEVKRLNLLIATTQDESLKLMFKKMLLFNLESLDKNSRGLLSSVINTHFKLTEKNVNIEIAHDILKINGREFTGPRQPFAQVIFGKLMNTKSVDAEKLATELFGISEFDGSIHNRLRVCIYRINMDFAQQFGIVKPLKLTKTEVLLMIK